MVESALLVREAVNLEGRPDDPGHLYFYFPNDHTSVVPDDQEKAHQRIERFATILRIAFREVEPTRFQEFFKRLLSSAQAAFSVHAFRPNALNDLDQFEKEIVQAAGAQIKARYTKGLLFSVIWASCIILVVSLGLEWMASFGTNADTELLAQRNAALPSDGETKPDLQSSQSKSIGNFLRWDKQFSFMHTGVLLAASMWGLLFASLTRNIDPTFETLVTPDADLMAPWVRLTFFGTAILVIALIFQLRIVAISFGDRLSTAEISDNVVTAVFVGLLLGIGERTLPKEVQHWSKKLLPSNQVNDSR